MFYKKYFKLVTEIILQKLHKQKTCTQKNCACVKFAFVFFAHLQICDFCIWKNICAADLRILCTTVFCTFAHLHIYTFAHLQKLAKMREMFLDLCEFANSLLHLCANMKKLFSDICTRFFGF